MAIVSALTVYCGGNVGHYPTCLVAKNPGLVGECVFDGWKGAVWVVLRSLHSAVFG